LQDMFATLVDVLDDEIPNPVSGQKGGEDSQSMLAAWQGERITQRVMFFNDHKEAEDHAVLAFREDDPVVKGTTVSGKWKLFFDADLLRRGSAVPVELFDLSTDPKESMNRLDEAALAPLVAHLTRRAVDHRTSGGHHLAARIQANRIRVRWKSAIDQRSDESVTEVDLSELPGEVRFGTVAIPLLAGTESACKIFVQAENGSGKSAPRFHVNQWGLGIVGGSVNQVDSGEAIGISFDRDVLIESVELIAGIGVCGGFYQKGTDAPLAIYCVDADIDSNDQSGILSDIGVLRKGQQLKLQSAPHYGVETKGQWRLGSVTVRFLGS